MWINVAIFNNIFTFFFFFFFCHINPHILLIYLVSSVWGHSLESSQDTEETSASKLAFLEMLLHRYVLKLKNKNWFDWSVVSILRHSNESSAVAGILSNFILKYKPVWWQFWCKLGSVHVLHVLIWTRLSPPSTLSEGSKVGQLKWSELLPGSLWLQSRSAADEKLPLHLLRRFAGRSMGRSLQPHWWKELREAEGWRGGLNLLHK